MSPDWFIITIVILCATEMIIITIVIWCATENADNCTYIQNFKFMYLYKITLMYFQFSNCCNLYDDR